MMLKLKERQRFEKEAPKALNKASAAKKQKQRA
jgi:hypothetical protein